jgi:uncharacterized protein
MRRSISRLLLLAAILTTPALAQPVSDEQFAALARRLLAADPGTDLDVLFRLQLATGRYSDARSTLAELRRIRTQTPSAVSPQALVQYEVYAEAKLREERDRVPFEEAFASAFRDVIGALDAPAVANQVRWVFGTSLPRLEADAKAIAEKHPDVDALSGAAANEWVRKLLGAQVFRSFHALVPALLEEDDRRRYIIEQNLVTTPDGARVCTLTVRPRNATAKVTALLNFTVYSGDVLPMFEARRTASHGYAGVEGFTRGKACSPDAPVPIEHDGTDAATVIDWIARQPWSDGRVGMYGGSYEGFTQWAAAKHLPKALKAIMPSVTFAPGIDFPMDGNVFMTYAYPWPFYTTNDTKLDDATYGDSARWSRMQREWYVSGRAYRDLAAIDGTPNPIFARWLAHPSYDAYWQRLIPFGKEFARIDIPVLTTTGYYDGGQIGALHYFAQHHRHRPGARHYLLVGPYDHTSGQRGTLSPLGRRSEELRGYRLDTVAHLDIGELRYEWFDHVFRNGPKPALLQDVVNYQVMGANVWKHAPSLQSMAARTMRLYLTPTRSGSRYRLASARPAKKAFIAHTVDPRDRTDVDRYARGELIDQTLDDWNLRSASPRIANAIELVSAPLAAGTEVSGLFSGQLEVIANKKDFDFSVTLFELTSAGEYLQLSNVWQRASYARSRTERSLLTPGRTTLIPFAAGRLTSRRFEPGSRLVAVIGVIKQPGSQINYGTGKEVSDETIADAGEPLRIRFSTRTYIDVPIGK